MKILGIDPGSSRCGYGLIKKRGGDLLFLKAGVLENKESDINQKLLYLSHDYRNLLEQERPDLIAIEKIFFSKNIKTAIEVAQARGVLILQSLQQAVPLMEFTPPQIKQAVTNYGGADKKAVAKMTAIILNQPNLNIIDDATDALAIAIAASNRGKQNSNQIEF